MTKEEMVILDGISKSIFGCNFSDLNFEDQSEVLVIMFEERGY